MKEELGVEDELDQQLLVLAPKPAMFIVVCRPLERF
jgi:hypothetical protein